MLGRCGRAKAEAPRAARPVPVGEDVFATVRQGEGEATPAREVRARNQLPSAGVTEAPRAEANPSRRVALCRVRLRLRRGPSEAPPPGRAAHHPHPNRDEFRRVPPQAPARGHYALAAQAPGAAGGATAADLCAVGRTWKVVRPPHTSGLPSQWGSPASRVTSWAVPWSCTYSRQCRGAAE